jgi:CheY-like chemotaxis protein
MRAQPPSHPILVVEDEPGPREKIRRILDDAGYPVVAVGNGEEALAELRHDHRPCLVVLDLMLPVMDGFEFRVRQMQDPEIADIPVIVVAGGVDAEQKAATLHADACLSKPVDRAALLKVVREREPCTGRTRMPRRQRSRLTARPARRARTRHSP